MTEPSLDPPESGGLGVAVPSDEDAEVLSSGSSRPVTRIDADHPSARAGRSRGDEATFDGFYDREMPRLVALAQALAGPAAADDLAQEAMIVAYRGWREVSRYEHPEAWVRRVCANAAVSLLRRHAAELRALVRLGARPQPVALEPSAERFWDQVRQLPRRQAQAIALRYVYDLELAEIAATMGCSVGAVKVHLSRARATLAGRIGVVEEDLG
jgi:RNA polymerase sigma-70 factor (ECF subfamily)